MQQRLKQALMGLAALAALALGGSALAQAGGQSASDQGGPAPLSSDRGDGDGERDDDGARDESEGEDESGGEEESGDQDATGPAADRAKDAALRITQGGQVNSVERDGEDGATWEVEVTRPDGTTADVRLDDAYGKVAVEDE